MSYHSKAYTRKHLQAQGATMLCTDYAAWKILEPYLRESPRLALRDKTRTHCCAQCLT